MLHEKLTKNFTYGEFLHSSTARRRGINNVPSQPWVKMALRELCAHVLQPLRDYYGKPIRVNSGYRSPELNKAVGGSSNSQHMLGQAADIEIVGVTNPALCRMIVKLNLPYDQLILEAYDRDDGHQNSGWTHISHVPHGLQRGQTGTYVPTPTGLVWVTGIKS